MKQALNGLIDRFQAKFPPNRLALVFGPVIAIAAAAVAPWLAEHFPGLPQFSTGQLTVYGVAGAAAVTGLAYKFIDGCQKDEKTKAIQVENELLCVHQRHLESMRLESRERVAIAEQADSPWAAAEALGISEPDTPGAAVSASVPASPPPVEVSAPAPGSFGSSELPDQNPEHQVAEELRETGLPPVPTPPHAAAEQAHGEEPIN